MIAFYVVLAMAGGSLGMMPIMTNGLSWLPPHLVGYGGAMNNVVQRGSAAFAVAIVGMFVSRSTAQLTVDENALQTIKDVPALAGASREQLLALYQHNMGQIQAKADGNAFLLTAGAAMVGVGLVWMLRKPPRPQPQPAPEEPEISGGGSEHDPSSDDGSAVDDLHADTADGCSRERPVGAGVRASVGGGDPLPERSDTSDLPEPRRSGRSRAPAWSAGRTGRHRRRADRW
jgi:hypothetical protein